MKSPMVTNLEGLTNRQHYSDLQVLHSDGGYYVGTVFTNVLPDGRSWQEPGSRDSGYFAKEEEAKLFLAEVERLGFDVAALMLRKTP